MTILTDIKRSLLKNLHVVSESLEEDESTVRLENYELVDYWVKPENRSFNIVVNYDSDERVEGIDFLSIVETFDPTLNDLPEEIQQNFDELAQLRGTLPSGWTFNPTTGFVYHEISAIEFKSLLQKYNLLNQFENELYDIAYGIAQENKQFDY